MFYRWVISATLWHLGFWYSLRVCNAFPCNSSHLSFVPWESELKVGWVAACALCCTFSSDIISICFSLPWLLSAPSLLKFLKPLGSGSQTCVFVGCSPSRVTLHALWPLWWLCWGLGVRRESFISRSFQCLYPNSYLPVSSLLEVPQDALSVLWVSRSLEQ